MSYATWGRTSFVDHLLHRPFGAGAPLLDLMASPEAADESRELLTPEMDGPISLGNCALCGDMVNDITASGHLIECIARQNLPAPSETDSSGYDRSLHLSVHDGSGLYWMELAVRADTTLRQLDEFPAGDVAGMLRPPQRVHHPGDCATPTWRPTSDDPNAADIRDRLLDGGR